jgi:hypothetical protein
MKPTADQKITITLKHQSVAVVLEIVGELRASGLVQGVDFDFAFHQSQWDDMIGEIPKHTMFTFYTEKYATLFALKYGSTQN